MPPSSARQHAEWLSLIEVSGPFLSLGTLVDALPQGLDGHDPEVARDVRAAHGEWENDGATDPGIHSAWTDFVLERVLGFPDEVRRRGQQVPPTLSVQGEAGEALRPHEVIVDPEGDRPRMLIAVHSVGSDLDAPAGDGRSAASPVERMEQLCAATGVRLGLATNGERWTLIDAAPGATTSRATWYAALWLEEAVTLRAFRTLLGVDRFFSVAGDQTLEALLGRSTEDQQSVTDQLGTQVRRAVELLVHSLDVADRTRDHSLLREVPDQEVYEACLTVMMRLVVLLSAEERDLLLLGDDLWDGSYAVGTLRARLRADADAHGEEVLQLRRDAWPRLLATFRAVYGGISHGSLRLPAYGGNLLDPDRFPFLEGRAHATDWRTTPAAPLPVDNRTVLHLLDALQQLEVKVPGGRELRALSFRGLDVEQIGHVYEGLLDHTAFRTSEPAIALQGKKEPELALRLIEEHALRGWDDLVAYLTAETGLTARGVEKRLDAELDEHAGQRLLVACESDEDLRDRVLPYAGLLRVDSFGYPLVFPEGALFVTEDPRRRNTGTHYTPPSLTEPIVRYALEPVVYEGPADGWERDRWRLKSAAELLDLKVADIAMGSGAFLVQACRYLAERLLEAWDSERSHAGDSTMLSAAASSRGGDTAQLIPSDAAERLIYARRLIASRCLYGVDKDPMAVEMAKLSLWLVTLQKDRPFTFLDHALRCGDSLLGLTRIEQLTDLNFDAGEAAGTLGLLTQHVHHAVEHARGLRAAIECSAPVDVGDAHVKAQALADAEMVTADLQLLSDLMVATDLGANDSGATLALFEEDAGALLARGDDPARTKLQLDVKGLLNTGKPAMDVDRRPFHWPLAFPEVFSDRERASGFDAVVGNPPFLGGKLLSGALGASYREYLVTRLADGRRGHADLCAYFFLQAQRLLQPRGSYGLLATNTIAQGDTREVALEAMLAGGGVITRATRSRPWPGAASLQVAEVWGSLSPWRGAVFLDGREVSAINSLLSESGRASGDARRLAANLGRSYIGFYTAGLGFVLSGAEAANLIARDSRYGKVVRPYLTGHDIQSSPVQAPERWVIDFADWTEEEAARYPDIFEIVRKRVRPERLTKKRAAHRRRWWIFGDHRPALRRALRAHALAFVRCRVTNVHSFVLLRSGIAPSEATVVVVADSWEDFAVIQSSPHEVWSWRYASSLGSGLRYTPSDCLETFPFPERAPGDRSALGESGNTLHDFRAERTRARNEGLTKLSNRVNDPGQDDDDLARLRELMATMDQEVAAAYGWNDLDLDHGFHETKLGRRFTIGPNARQEILDRLLELNHERYAEEVRRGLHDKKKARRTRA